MAQKADNYDLGQQIAKLTGKLECLTSIVDNNRDKITSMERRYYIPQAPWKFDPDDAKRVITENLDRVEKKQHKLENTVEEIQKTIHSHNVRLSVLRGAQDEIKKRFEAHERNVVMHKS